MQKGYNSDVELSGNRYHIQTEDWGPSNPFIVSKIFKSGAVIKSVKVPYSEILKFYQKNESEAVKSALRDQHSRILDLLVSGQLILK